MKSIKPVVKFSPLGDYAPADLVRTFCLLQGYLAHQKPRPLGPYSRTMPRALWYSYGGGRFLMSEVNLYRHLD